MENWEVGEEASDSELGKVGEAGPYLKEYGSKRMLHESGIRFVLVTGKYC